MNIYTIYDESGQVVMHFHGTEQDAKLNVPEGGSYKAGKHT